MGNLSAREKFLTLAILLIIVIFGLQMLVLNPQKDKNSELTAQYEELKNEKARKDQLIEANQQNTDEIERLNESIKEMEVKFIPVLNAESLQMWVMKKFENAGCPYLVSISIADVAEPAVILPNGEVSPNALAVKRITVSYSTTDGFNVPQYNAVSGDVELDWDNWKGTYDNDITYPEWIAKVSEGYKAVLEYRDSLNDDLSNATPITYDTMFKGSDDYGRVGYAEFISALKSIEETNPFAIKVNTIDVKDNVGSLTLTATIDFYSAKLANRVSDPADYMHEDYIEFKSTNPQTGVGLIGLPLYPVLDENSSWAYTTPNVDDVIGASRPFAAYYSSALFTYFLEQYKDLGLVLGVTGGVPNVPVYALDSDDIGTDAPATPDDEPAE